MKKIKLTLLLILFTSIIFSQKGVIKLEGTITDINKEPLPYVAISILSKSIGTSSNDDGGFSLKITKENFEDIITVSTIGFKTVKIKVQDFINQKEKTIILEEDVVSLDEITLINYTSFVKGALKNLRKTTYSSGHQLNVLYRRFSTENNVSRFLVEQYIKIYDRGPTSEIFEEVEIAEDRRSVDYRYVKKKQNFHAVMMTAKQNTLRIGINRRDYNWEVVDDTSYDGEEIIVIEGKMKNTPGNWVILYIGIDTKGIYKLEKSANNAIYIYKKNEEGKLVLSYHNREYKSLEPITPYLRKLLKLNKNKIKVSYRHEAIVLGIVTARKKIKVSGNIIKGKDIGDYEIPYNATFWKNLNLPPDSKFYKKSVKELESLFGVPIENQFNAVN